MISYWLATHLVFFALPSPGQNPLAAAKKIFDAIIEAKNSDLTIMSEIFYNELGFR